MRTTHAIVVLTQARARPPSGIARCARWAAVVLLLGIASCAPLKLYRTNLEVCTSAEVDSRSQSP